MPRELEGRRFFIHTFGCQMNENDSRHIAGLLESAGASRTVEPEAADILLVNTCAVRKKSEEKLFSYLGRLAGLKARRRALIGVLGCVAQVYRERLLARNPHIDLVMGPGEYPVLVSALLEAEAGPCVRTGFGSAWREIGPQAPPKKNTASAYVSIMEGCDNFCSYCVVPFSRGRERSRPFKNILDEVNALTENGVREIQLLGQNVNSYRDPVSGRGLPELIDALEPVPGLKWLRFITSHPRDFKQGLIAAVKRNRKVCRQVHLPLQSGSTEVLRRMNRGYSREEYLELVSRIRESVPEMLFSTDIIVGFPGETEADFRATCDVLERVRFAAIFSFRYSPRPYSAASRLEDDVPLEVKRRRLVELQELQKGIQLDFHRSFVGREIEVLCGGPSPRGAGRFSGRSEGGQVVNFDCPEDRSGSFVRVLVTGCGPYSLHGRAVA
jgi:tRNA-2-methylthio-N6-dimethylallyladenosine synthase